MFNSSTQGSFPGIITPGELRLFEAIPGNNLILSADHPDYTVLGATDDYLRVAKKKKEELIGRGIFEAFPANPGDLSDTGEYDLRFSFNEVVAQKRSHQLQTQRYDIPDGHGGFEKKYWNAINTPLMDDDGNVKFIIHSVVDITAQVNEKQRENRIRTIEKEHGHFMDAPYAIQILKGPDLMVEMANKLTLEIWGKGNNVLGKPLREVLPELIEQGYLDLIDKVRLTGEIFEAYEVPAYLKRNGNNELHYFNLIYKPFYEEDKVHAEGVLIFASDVTEKVAAKKELQKAGEEFKKLASITNASHEFIGLAEPGTAIHYLNQSATDMLGWDGFEGRYIIDCVFPDDRPLALQLIPQLKKEGTFSQEIRFWNEKTGEPFWVKWNGFTIRNDEGEIIGLATVSPNITEHINSSRALRESHQRFEAAIQAIQGTLWTNNAEGKMEGVQKGWAELTGQSYEEYQGYGWANAIHPDDALPTIDAWQEAINEAKPFVFEHRLKTKKGKWDVYSVRAIPLKNEDGSIREWVGVHTDITEQRKAEQKTRESEERFRKLADESPMFVFIIGADENATVTYWNKTWLDYTGQTMDKAIGRAWDGIFHQDDIPVVMEHYSPAFAKQQSYFIPAIRVKRYDNEYRWHSFKGNPRYTPSGEFYGYVGVGFDIHEQKLGELATRQSEAQLQVKVAERTAELEEQKNLLNNILTNSSNGISVTEMIRDEKGEIYDARTILANDAAVRFTGLPRNIYLVKTARELDPGILESPYGQTCLKTLQTGEPSLIQYFLGITGRWLELTISKMDDDHLIHIFTDVTNIKEAQLELERTVEELKRSNANLEEFAYAASHDLKEPIRKINFFSDRIRTTLQERMTEKEKHSFDRLETASKRMNSLIDDLLAYSHLNHENRQLDEVDLNQLLALVLDDLDLEIEQKAAVIETGNLGMVKGYHRQLQQAFQNIIGNSIKYSKPGIAPKITITYRKEAGIQTGLILVGSEKEKSFHVIEITDNGIGFDPQYSDKIFNVFTRLHHNSDYAGTGLGLSIVKKIIENHLGYITAESEPGKGSIFKIYLPV